ncbi:hypothetical protein SASPL_111412 [Salvia splendens]|uniref:Uncharacterized protein n=1 Tax=Salvia splendens TaxID=180675 RepID=A0A8X9A2D1_SALSN|nr:hypothetical protein SASPL_111412 [Salvia splendens]
MSSQDEDRRSLDKDLETHDDVSTKPKISYSREFLLSISNSDICKKSPSGFDESLRIWGEELLRLPDRTSIPGRLPYQGFRRNEYSSSPPTRGDTNTYSRGIYGKWDGRYSARSDRDSDSQSDKDSDSGKRFGNHSRHSWQTPEHDGLLGSGSFPRPSGYAAGISAAKVQPNEQTQLSRSVEPYHPPRPYKAVPHSRKDTDAFNDETFGSMESTNEDRAEQERRRRGIELARRKGRWFGVEATQAGYPEAMGADRPIGYLGILRQLLVPVLGGICMVAEMHTSEQQQFAWRFPAVLHLSDGVQLRGTSFEMMRKEQHKVLQEKQNSNSRNSKVGDVLSLCEGLVDSKEDKGLFSRNNELEISAVSNDSEKSSLSSQAPASRPLVPPGFKTNLLEKSSGLKSLIHPSLSEVSTSVTTESTTVADPNLIQNANHGIESCLTEEISVFGRQPAEKTQHTILLNKGEHVNGHVGLDGPKQAVLENQLFCNFSPLQIPGTPDDPNFTKLNDDGLEDKTVHDSSISHSTSILGKIFGSTLSTKSDGHSNSVEKCSVCHFCVAMALISQAHITEAKVAADVSSAGQNDLLSLIVGTAANGISDQACSNNKVDTVPAVLTCEDLEQSILSKYDPKPMNTQPHLKSFTTAEGDIAQSSGHADNHTSLHLLSMLQKSSDQISTVVNPSNINLANKQLVSQENDRTTVVTEPKEEENGNLGKTLTLEALFGTAFMKELESVGAPVSVQGGSTGSARVDAPGPHAFPFPVKDNDISSSTVEHTGLQRPVHDYNVPSNRRQIAKLNGADNWLGVGDSSIGISSPKRQTESLNKRDGFERNAGYQLPEEENLISAGDSRDPRLLQMMPVGNSINSVNSSSTTPINIAEKLAVLGGIINDKHSMGGSEGTPFPHGSHEQRGPDISYLNLQLQQQSSQHFQHPRNTQPRPLYHHLDSHPANMSSHLKFLSPERTSGHDSPVNYQPSSPMIRPSFHHNPNVRVSGFDVPPPQHPLLHQMQMTGNHPQFGRGGPVPHHGNQPTGFVQEMNQTQGLPFGSRLPNIGGSVVPMPGGTPPEVFQRLIEMELRANSKQIHPFVPPGHNQGIYSHELDLESASASMWTKRSGSCLSTRAEAEDQLPGAEPALRSTREWIQLRWRSSMFSTSAELVKHSFSTAVSSMQMSVTTSGNG